MITSMTEGPLISPMSFKNVLPLPPGKNSDSQNALEDLAHYEFLAQLRKASTSASLLDHLSHNGATAMYHPGSRHDELPPAIWSPGAQHRSPDAAGITLVFNKSTVWLALMPNTHHDEFQTASGFRMR